MANVNFIQNTFNALHLGKPNLANKFQAVTILNAKLKALNQTHISASSNHQNTSQVNQNVNSQLSKPVSSISKAQKNENGASTERHTDYTTAGTFSKSANTTSTHDTELRVLSYDKSGQVVGNKFNHQQVNVNQNVSINQTSQGSSTNDIKKQVAINNNPALTRAKTEYSEAHAGTRTVNTQTVTDKDINVKNLDEQGNLLSSTDRSQLVKSDSTAQIDFSRTYNRNTESKTKVEGNAKETDTNSIYKLTNDTKTKTKTITQVQNFDGNGNLINDRTGNSQSTTVSSYNIDGHSRVNALVTKENGVTTTVQRIEAKEKRDIDTDITSTANGVVSHRDIDTRANVTTDGKITTVDQNGSKTVSFEATKKADSKSKDVAANRQADSQSSVTTQLNGTLELAGAASGTGGVIVEVGSFTGVRSTLKFDNGTLKFDFTVERGSTGTQTVTTGSQEKSSATSVTQASKETVHFTGEIVSSVDANGTQTFSINASVSDSSLSGKFTGSQGKPLSTEAEQKQTDLKIEGKLSVNRTSTTIENETTTQVTSSGELNVNKVESIEDAGANVTTLVPIADKGVSAGFSVNNGALSFNFGTFDFRLRTAA